MRNKLKKRLPFILYSLFFILYSSPAQAVCPVCTVAVGAGVGLSRYLGIDDLISGIWIGGLSVSLIAWTIDWLNKKQIKFKGRKILVTVGYYALIVLPLYYTGIMGHSANIVWGVDRLLWGIILGSFLFVTGMIFNFWIKKKNNGKVFFPFQKVACSVAPLFVFSLVLYFTI